MGTVKVLFNAAVGKDGGARVFVALCGRVEETTTRDRKTETEVNCLASRIIDAVLRLKDEFTAPLGKSVKLLTDAGKEGARTRKVLNKMGQGIANVGKTITASVTAPIVGMGVAGVANFANVDKTVQLTNATMGNTAEQAQMLSSAMKEAAANSTFGMSDAATATLNFARAGLSAKQAADALAPAMNLAAGEGGSLDTVSAGLVATINGFGDSFRQTKKYADVFAAACNNSALDVDSMASAMSTAAPIFSAAGYAVDDAALYMGVMANAGIPAAEAANSLKTGFARLISPAKEGAETMKQLGISVTKADGSMKSTMEIQNDLNKAFGGLSESEQIAAASAIFGKNQMSKWLALINTAPKDVQALSGAIGEAAGTTNEMASAMMSGTGGSIEKLKSSIDVLVYTIGETLAPAIQPVIDKVQGFLDTLNQLSPAEREQAVHIGAMAAAIGPCVMMFGKLMQGATSFFGAISVLRGGLQNATAAGGLFKGALADMSAPLGVVIGVVAAIAAVVAVVVTHLDQFKEAAANVAAVVGPAFANLQNALAPVIEAIRPGLEWLGDFLANVLCGAFQLFGEIAAGVINWIAEGIRTFVERVQTHFAAVIEVITFLRETWGEIWSNISETVSGVIETIRNVIGGIVGTISGIIARVRGVVVGAWKAVWDKFHEIVDGVIGKVKEIIDGVREKIQWVTDHVSGAIDAVKGFFGFGDDDKKKDVGHNAGGTSDWRGGLTTINERGGEIIDLPQGTRIYPHDVSMGMARQSGGGITIAKLADSIVVREDADIDRIATAIATKLAQAQSKRGGYSYNANMA